MKRTIWSAVAALVLAAAVAIPAIAQPPQGGRGPGRGPAFDGVLPILRGLNLTDAQREQIRALTDAQRTADNPRRNLMDLERQLQAALLADSSGSAEDRRTQELDCGCERGGLDRADRSAVTDRAGAHAGAAGRGTRGARKSAGETRRRRAPSCEGMKDGVLRSEGL